MEMWCGSGGDSMVKKKVQEEAVGSLKNERTTNLIKFSLSQAREV